MKLSVLILLASLLALSATQGIEASQFLYDTLIAYPKQCIQQNCSSEVVALQNNPQFQACKPICQYNITCWETCGQQIPNQPLINLDNCIANNECYQNAENQIGTAYLNIAILDLICLIEQYESKKYIQEYQLCSIGCGTDQLCVLDCPKSAAIQNALYLAQCYIYNGNSIPSGYYQPLYNPNCVYNNCPSQCGVINNNPELPELTACFHQCLADKNCWTSCVPQSQQQNVNQCMQCAKENNCKQTYYF